MTFLVQKPDGTYTRKAEDELQPDDLVVLDGPDAFDAVKKLQAELEREIADAGGLEAWRVKNRPPRP